MCLTSLARMLLRKVIGSSSAIVQERPRQTLTFVFGRINLFSSGSRRAFVSALLLVPQGLRLYCSATP